jgi:NAD(P)-dependent dehydrogenase (short-subunit alcohol dehydrogenase family)
MEKKFDGKKVLVVGTATGMGAATVRMLLEQGANVIAFDVDDAEQAKRKEEIAAESPEMLERLDVVIGDITDKSAREGLISHVKESFGTLDSLVYVAGVTDMMCPPTATDDELWDYVMDVNCNCAFKTIRDALPMMLDHEGPSASIAIVGSVGSFVGGSSGTSYIASKHAVAGMAKNLAWTYHWRNLRVNVVNPGGINTSIMPHAAQKWPGRPLYDPEGADVYYQRGIISLQMNAEGTNLLGEPEDIARALLFCLDDENGFLTGAEITVDGGWTSM